MYVLCVGMWSGCKLVLNTSSGETGRGRCGMMLYIVGSWNEKDGERMRGYRNTAQILA
jgi:hypothetical protein